MGSFVRLLQTQLAEQRDREVAAANEIERLLEEVKRLTAGFEAPEEDKKRLAGQLAALDGARRNLNPSYPFEPRIDPKYLEISTGLTPDLSKFLKPSPEVIKIRETAKMLQSFADSCSPSTGLPPGLTPDLSKFLTPIPEVTKAQEAARVLQSIADSLAPSNPFRPRS